MRAVRDCSDPGDEAYILTFSAGLQDSEKLASAEAAAAMDRGLFRLGKHICTAAAHERSALRGGTASASRSVVSAASKQGSRHKVDSEPMEAKLDDGHESSLRVSDTDRRRRRQPKGKMGLLHDTRRSTDVKAIDIKILCGGGEHVWIGRDESNHWLWRLSNSNIHRLFTAVTHSCRSGRLFNSDMNFSDAFCIPAGNSCTLIRVMNTKNTS